MKIFGLNVLTDAQLMMKLMEIGVPHEFVLALVHEISQGNGSIKLSPPLAAGILAIMKLKGMDPQFTVLDKSSEPKEDVVLN